MQPVGLGGKFGAAEVPGGNVDLHGELLSFGFASGLIVAQSGKAWESTLFYLEFGGFGILPNGIFGEKLPPVLAGK